MSWSLVRFHAKQETSWQLESSAVDAHSLDGTHALTP